MDESKPGIDLYSTAIVLLIAVVSIVGAIVTWRVSVALSDAGTADTLGILAVVEKEDVTTRATITLVGHLTAYAAFVRDDALAKSYAEVSQANPQRTDLSTFALAFRAAANYAQNAIPAAYFDRNQKLDRQRDLGEQIAQGSLGKDVDPQLHFSAADASRAKAGWLLVSITLFGFALLCLTLADAIQNLLRYLFFFAGVGFFAIGALAALFIELFGVPGL